MNPPVKNPPCDHKLEIPTGCQLLPNPRTITNNPRMIITIIVTTLIIANQNSNRPYALADARFASVKIMIITNPEIQSGKLGHQ